MGFLPTGTHDAITDVAGVRVGHQTVWRGEPGGAGPVIRSGVTAIWPHTGDLFRERLYAAISVFNGYGEMTSRSVIDEWGLLGSPIVLTERRDHLDFIAQELSKAAKNVIVLQGGMTEKTRREVSERLEAIPRDEERVIVATGRFAGEGFDDPRLDTLFLALPVSWKGTLIQYAGRLHRHLPDKTEVRIYDYVDAGVPLLEAMFRKRLRGYRAMGYSIDPRAKGAAAQ